MNSYSKILTDLRRANPEGFARIAAHELDHYEKFVTYLRTSLNDNETIKSYKEIAELCAKPKTVQEIILIEKAAYNKIINALGIK